jgi:outer membrane biosynthesis protein TonB
MATVSIEPVASAASAAREKHRLPAAAAVALIVEAAILALAWFAIQHKSAEPPPERAPTLLSLTSEPVPPAPKPEPPHPVVQPPKPHVVQPHRRRRRRPRPRPRRP